MDPPTHPLPNFNYLGFVELLNFAKPLNIEVVNCSYQGAVQLECDSRFVRSWLQTALQSGDVKQSVLSLDVFLYLQGIVQLLKQQPHGDGEKVATQKQRHPCEYWIIGQRHPCVLFFPLFPFCRGEAGHLSLPYRYGYFRHFFHCLMLLAFSLHFSSYYFFLISIFAQFSHLSCGLPHFLWVFNDMSEASLWVLNVTFCKDLPVPPWSSRLSCPLWQCLSISWVFL